MSFPIGAAAARGDGVGSVAQVDKAFFGVLLIVALNTIFAGLEGDGTIGYGHTVRSAQTVAGDVDLVGAAGDHQVIFGHHSMSPLRGDGEGASPVEGQVRFGENHTVDVVVVNGHVGTAIFQSVVRVRSGGEKHLVGRGNVDGGGGCTGDVSVVQNQLDFIRLRGLYHHHTVLQGPGEKVGALLGDGNGAPVHGDGVAVAGRGGTQLDVSRTLLVITELKVPVTEQLGQVHVARGNGLRGRKVLTGYCGSG